MFGLNTETAIWDALEDVIDPELGTNIVDLGLVYDVSIDEAGKAKIEMTLTVPECPMADEIVASTKNATEALPGVNDVDIELVWEPKWTPARMNDRAREEIRAHHLS